MSSGRNLVLRGKMSFLDRNILFAYGCVHCCAAEHFVFYLVFGKVIKLQAIKLLLIDAFSAPLPKAFVLFHHFGT